MGYDSDTRKDTFIAEYFLKHLQRETPKLGGQTYRNLKIPGVAEHSRGFLTNAFESSIVLHGDEDTSILRIVSTFSSDLAFMNVNIRLMCNFVSAFVDIKIES